VHGQHQAGVDGDQDVARGAETPFIHKIFDFEQNIILTK
jgi:hypothetical protein